MRLFWVEIKSSQILYTVIKICLFATVIYFLISLLTSHVVENSGEKNIGFHIKNKQRIGVCLDTKDNNEKFKLMQKFFNTVLPECPCCSSEDKNLKCETLSECKKCKYFFKLLQNEKCDELKDEDFEYLKSLEKKGFYK